MYPRLQCALNRVKPSAIPNHDCSYNLNWEKNIVTKKLSNSRDLHTKFTQKFSFPLLHLANKLHACIHIQPTIQIALDCVTPRQSEESTRAYPQLTPQVNWTPLPTPKKKANDRSKMWLLLLRNPQNPIERYGHPLHHKLPLHIHGLFSFDPQEEFRQNWNTFEFNPQMQVALVYVKPNQSEECKCAILNWHYNCILSSHQKKGGNWEMKNSRCEDYPSQSNVTYIHYINVAISLWTHCSSTNPEIPRGATRGIEGNWEARWQGRGGLSYQKQVTWNWAGNGAAGGKWHVAMVANSSCWWPVREKRQYLLHGTGALETWQTSAGSQESGLCHN